MNYITLKLGGKDRGAKIGIGYLKHLTDVYNCSLDDIFKKIEGAQSILVIPEFIYHSISFNDKKAGRKIDYTIDDVIDWLDDAGGVTSKEWNLFQESLLQSVGVDPKALPELEGGKQEPQVKVAK